MESLWSSARALLALSSSLDDFATGLYGAVARVRPDVVPSLIKVADGRLYPVGRSGLPQEYDDTVRGAVIGEGVGACGTAASRGAPVLARRFAGDPLWAALADAGVPDHLVTCWSTPIIEEGEGVLGTLALYWSKLVTPRREDLDLVEALSGPCRTALAAYWRRPKTQLNG